MQTTLLSIAIALIVALVAALVGPLFIDWGSYRALFEVQATRLVGLPVHITGKIDARLLPVPMVSLHGVDIGSPGQSARLRVQGLDVELALGPLARGQWRATALHLDQPEFGIGLDEEGKLEGLGLPSGLDPDRLSIDRLVIDNGHVVLRDAASGARMVLDQLWFHGDMRSLIGPFKGEGAFVSAGQLYGYSLASSRRGDDGGSKMRLSVDPADRPLTIETEGTVFVENGAPRFEGTASLARPVAVTLASGKKVVSEPWRLSSRVRANSGAALLEQFEFQYGPEERAIKLSGTANLVFGPRPRFEGVLSARQIDLDRSFAGADGAQRLPLATLRSVTANLGDAIRPPLPVKLGIGIDSLTVGGAALQSVRGDIESDAEAWNLQTLEFKAPGLTDVQLSGRLKVTPKATEFVGPAAIESNDPNALVAWIEGLGDTPKMLVTSLKVRGDVTLGSERVAIDRLKAQADRRTFEGRLAYSFATEQRRARMDAMLSASDIDVDAGIAFGNAALAGSKFEWPSEIALALDIDRATLAGAEAKHVAANVAFDAGGLKIERFSISDLAGATVTANGRIDASAAPRGSVAVTLDAQKLDALPALAAKFAPAAVERVRAYAARSVPARLNASLSIEPLGDGQKNSAAKLLVDGKLGATRINVNAEAKGDWAKSDWAKGDWAAISAADVKVESALDADDGTALTTLLGLDRLIATDKRPARVTLSAAGSADKELRVDGKMTGAGFEGTASGTLKRADQIVQGTFDLSATAADATALRREPATPVPVAVKTKLTLAGNTLSLRDLSVTVAGSTARGQISLVLGQPARIEGRIAAETIDVPGVIDSAIGVSAQSTSAMSTRWSSEPFAPTLLDNLEGKVSLYAVRAALAPGIVMQPLGGTVRFEPGGVALEEGEGRVADGRLTVQASVRRGETGLAARGQFALANADLAALSGAQPRASGRLSLQVEAESSGLSPATLIGALRGTGTISVDRLQFAGLDPTALTSVIQGVDRGLAVDSAKINDLVVNGLQAGKLNVASANGTVTITSGRASISSLAASTDGADVALNGLIDLTEQRLDLGVKLTASAKGGVPSGQRPDVTVAFRGPISAPLRTTDVSTFINWLTLRSVDRETKKLEELQSKDPKQVGSTPGHNNQHVEQKPGEKAPDLPPPQIIKPNRPRSLAPPQ